MNILHEIDQCKEALAKAKDQNAKLPEKALSKFTLAENLLIDCLRVLNEINENILDLTSLDDVSVKLEKAHEFWESLPNGRIREEHLKMLVERSALSLQRLRAGGIDIIETYKFSDDEMRLASDLGPNFEALEKVWADWRWNALKNQKNHLLWTPTRGQLDNDEFKVNPWFKKFYNIIYRVYTENPNHEIRQLKDRKAAQSKLAELKISNPDLNFKDLVEFPELWERMQDGWKSYSNPNFRNPNAVKIDLGKPINTVLFNFLQGDWFEAYVAHQFSDQLQRVDIPHETYMRVKYETVLNSSSNGVNTKQLGGHFSGEIDVIVATDEKIVCIECKSGRLKLEDADRAVHRRDVIQGALKEVGLDPSMTLFAIVHAPRNENDEVPKFLEEKGMRVLGPADVSKFARSTFDGSKKR